jgi:glycerophosphoryl diester phosphodiesterase
MVAPAVATSPTPSALPEWPFPRWIAHRGAGKLAPENTLAAFRLGASHGYRAFECDVKLSADDVPFLLHDGTLDRTTNARGRAADRPWSELSRLDAGGWHSRAYAGEPPISLQALATFLRRNRYWLDLEIKPTKGDEERTGRLVAAEVERLWAGDLMPPLLSSFRPEALDGARQTAPGLARALLVDTHWPNWVAVAQQLGCVAAITNYHLMDAALVQHLHGCGLRALVYTVNDPAPAQQLLAMGIDGIITDAVDAFAPQ